MHHKYLTVFEIRKTACQLISAFVLTVVMYSAICSSVEMERCQRSTALRQSIVCQNSLLQLHSVVSVSSFKDLMLLAAILCYCGYRNGVKKDQWWTVNNKDVHFWHAHLAMWSGQEAPCCKVRTGQLGGKRKGMQRSQNSQQGFALPSIYNPSCSGP